MNPGRCLCGKVRYEVDGGFFAVVHCHCSMCRKHHGTPFATWAVVERAHYRLTAGGESIARYESSPGTHRASCRTCGSVTPEPTPDGQHVVVPAGNLDGDLPGPELHMFVQSQAPWHVIADSLPRHDEWPPGYGMAPVVRPPRATAAGRAGVHGSCLCGAVAYVVESTPVRFMYCHCRRCRLARSAAHASNLFYPLDGFRWLQGEELVDEYALPEAQRFGVAFCRRCGSGLPRPSPTRNVVLVPAGSLDDDPGMRPEAHIFIESRAGWDVIGADGIPRYAELPAPTA
jgi:hypothetical protein